MWLNLEDVILSEISPSQKGKCYKISTHMRCLERSNAEAGSRRWGPGAPGAGRGMKGKLVFNGDRVSVWDDGKFWRWAVTMATQHCEYT